MNQKYVEVIPAYHTAETTVREHHTGFGSPAWLPLVHPFLIWYTFPFSIPFPTHFSDFFIVFYHTFARSCSVWLRFFSFLMLSRNISQVKVTGSSTSFAFPSSIISHHHWLRYPCDILPERPILLRGAKRKLSPKVSDEVYGAAGFREKRFTLGHANSG